MQGRDSKVHIHIYISKDVNRKLRRLIAVKYGSYKKGMFSAEIEKALRYWIEFHEKTEIAKIEKPVDKDLAVYYDVLDFLREEKGFYPFEITEKDLRLAIARTRGSDDRTIRKWLNRFLERGFISMTARGVYRLLKRPSKEEIEEEELEEKLREVSI